MDISDLYHSWTGNSNITTTDENGEVSMESTLVNQTVL